MRELVAPAACRRIEAALGRIETERGVRVLLAVESGSRAWGFPSSDSDYDVRFVYVATIDDYLSLAARRDVIEQPIADDLDVNGWDLRKALGLALRSNAVVIEWLCSPLRYRDDPSLTTPLRDIVLAAAQLPALEYHYDRMARRAFADIAGAVRPRLKRYFYALRPALALRWLRARRMPPPMDLASLLAGADVPTPLVDTVAELIARKAAAHEGDTVDRVPVVDTYLQQTLASEVTRPSGLSPTAEVAQRAQNFFTSVARGLPYGVERTATEQ
jgi:predicted nucleotidyltransferase